jgi:microsomal dipeptidase-like Zn-dependent dipeptidase
MTPPHFVDIHVHPDLKSFLSSNDEIDRNDCWQDLNLPLIGQIIDRLFLGNILESQSSLNQLNSLQGAIAMTGLYAFERAMIKGDLFNSLLIHVDLLTIAKVLEIIGIRGLLDYKLLKRSSKCRARIFRLFNEAHSHLLLSGLMSPGFNMLKKISDYDPNSLNVILTAEGGHNLFRSKCGCHVRKKVMAIVEKMKKGQYRFLFIGPAHIERNRLCNHAYAIKFLHHRHFLPVGNGITDLGREAIKKLLKKEKRILIDIKHMSLISRKQYYEILHSDEFRAEKIPIIASHVGMTGKSYNDKNFASCEPYNCRWIKVQHIPANGIISGTKFNPWSINLYNEEIKEIIDSKGLIGLSLDARILGARQEKDEDLVEYFSRKEFTCPETGRRPTIRISQHIQAPDSTLTALRENELELTKIKEIIVKYLRNVFRDPENYQKYKIDLDEIKENSDKLLDEQSHLISMIQASDLDHLCNNILHIVKTGGQIAWKHICIGSDFDGLVSAVDCCKNVAEYNALARKLKQKLMDLAPTNPTLIPVNSIAQIVDDIMAGNAYNFLLQNFN